MTGLRERIEAERAALLDAAEAVEAASRGACEGSDDPWVEGYLASADDVAGWLRDRACAS